MDVDQRNNKEIFCQHLIHQAQTFDFYHLLRLVEVNFSETAIIITATHKINFPASDIASMTFNDREDKKEIIIHCNFLGLYSVDSPLPHYLHRAMIIENSMGAAIRRFLIPVQNRIYQLLYLAWKKCKLYASSKANVLKLLHYLRAISGGVLCLHHQTEFAYAGLLGMRTKNPLTLAVLLRRYLRQFVVIETFIPQWLLLDKTPGLGVKLYLANNALLGERVLAVSNSIKIIIGPCELSFARLFLSRESDVIERKALVKFIQLYIPVELDFEIIMKVIVRPMQLTLGCKESKLSSINCLGRVIKDYVVVKIFG